MDRGRIIALNEGEIMRKIQMATLCGEFGAREHLDVADALTAALDAYKRETRPPMLKIVIPGAPVTKKNSQRIVRLGNGRPSVRPSKKFEDYQELAGYYIPKKLRMKLDRPVNVKCLYYMPTRRRVDLVNLLEATCDILVHYGVLADDHCGIVASHDGSQVLYDKQNQRAEIEIREALNGKEES